ncbi:putative transcriptional regulator [Paracoccus phage vB_PmaP_KLEP18-1]|nr:putative transcriptional regulator [Paracoccus phage vB_PmaP_KLEP18-1]
MTPWQRVFARFGITQAELAREIGMHRSNIWKNLRHPEGLINGRDQLLLMQAAKRRKVRLTAGDLLPRVE